MPALNAHLYERLQSVPEDSRRQLLQSTMLPCGKIKVAGQIYDHFSGNDYLGLSQHADVIQAAAQACNVSAGAGASRLVTGNHAHYEALEVALAHHTRHEKALVFSSGYAATIGTISALMGKGDLILADKLAHACMIDGAMLSGARLMRFRHNDVAHARAVLHKHQGQYKNALIVTEHVFSMDGDISPIDELLELKNDYDCWLMVDDAHGHGIVEYVNRSSVDIWCGTLSKALASVGGYVTGSALLIDFLLQHARSFIFSTALPPSAVAAAATSLSILEREPWRGARALTHAQHVCKALGLAAAQSAIVPIVLGSNSKALAASKALKEQHLWVSAIRPPTVPNNSARLRVTLSAAHEDDQIERLITAIKPWVAA